MKYSIVVFLLCCMPAFVLAQSVLIAGEAKSCPEGTEIYAYQPIGSFYNSDERNLVGKVLAGKFAITLTQKEPAFIVIESKFFRTILFTEPNDSIYIEIMEQDGKPSYKFHGNNAIGHELLNAGKVYSGKKTMEDVDRLFSTARTVDSAVSLFRKTVSSYYLPLQSLLEGNQITTIYYNNVAANVESYAELVLANVVIAALDSSTGAVIPVFTKDELRSILRKVYDIYDPFSIKYLPTLSAFATAELKCRAIEMGVVPGNNKFRGMWQHFGQEYQGHGYAPIAYQELMMGKCLLFNLANRMHQDSVLAEQVNDFKTQFPGSHYIPIARKMLDGIYGHDANGFTGRSVFGHYDAGIDSMDGGPLGRDFKNIHELVNTRFIGKAVLIDLWATWCSPCREEFKYERKLRDFLEKNQVEMLYVTFDFESNQAGWIKYVHEYKLSGYHYFPGKAFRESMEKTLNSNTISIPRYILFDSSGTLAEMYDLRPSSGENFFNRISEVLTSSRRN